MRLALLMTFLVILVSTVTAEVRDILTFPLPQYMTPLYDGFSHNYINAQAVGRGYTGVAQIGNIEQVMLNPACLLPEKSGMVMELTIKPPIQELDKANDENYSSPYPFSLIGFGGNLTWKLSGALLYSMPRSIVYDDFNITMNQGNYLLQYYPSYYLHQVTGTLSYEMGNMRVGLNLHNQWHVNKDITFIHTFDRVSQTTYLMRFQPGLYYRYKSINIGATYTPSQFFSFQDNVINNKLKIELPYLTYETKLPQQATFGVSLQTEKRTFNAEVEYEGTSEMSELFKDKIVYKVGYETRINKFTYRIGFFTNPSVYHGTYSLPDAGVDYSNWWDQIPQQVSIGKTNQYIGTLGVTYYFKGGTLTLSALSDVHRDFPVTQVLSNLSVDFDTFKRKPKEEFE